MVTTRDRVSISIAKMTALTTLTGVSKISDALMTLHADNIQSSREMASARAVAAKKLPKMERIVKKLKRNAQIGPEDNPMVIVSMISATAMKRSKRLLENATGVVLDGLLIAVTENA